MAALGPQLLQCEPGEGPHGLLRVGFPHPADKGDQYPLIFRLEGLAAQQGQSLNVRGGQQV